MILTGYNGDDVRVKTISMCQGKGSLSHNNREFSAKNIDRSRTKDNIVFVREDIKTAYDKLFGEAVARYNAKQKRSDRKIKDYFQHLFSRTPSQSVITGVNKQKSFYEDLVQIGTKDDTGIGTADSKIAAECLREYMDGFQQRNPNFYVFNAVMHLDEATPHLHFDYIPIGHFECGLDTRNAMAKALEEMGFGKGKDAINRWRLSEHKVLENICNAHGIEISEPKKSRGYSFTVEEYGEYKDTIRQLEVETEKVTADLEKTQAKFDAIKDKKAKLTKIENIETGKKIFGGKVTVSKDDYDNLSALAKKEVVSERQTHKLKSERDTLLKEVAELEQKVSELSAELAEYKKPATISMKHLVQNSGSIDEAEQLRSMLKRALDILKAHGLQKEYEHYKQSAKNKNI